jgi:hypothetical protein
MRTRPSASLLVFVASGLAGGAAPLALAAPPVGNARVVNISGATLLQNFINAPASMNDYIDANGNFISGSLGTSNEALARQTNPNAAFSPAIDGYWNIQYRASGSVRGVQELVDFGRTFDETLGGNPDTTGGIIFSDAADGVFYNGRNIATNNILNIANPASFPIRSYITTNGLGQEDPSNPDYLKALYTSPGIPGTTPDIPQRGGIRMDIAVTDVPATWAFTGTTGSADAFLQPAQAGYGRNARTPVGLDGTPIAFSNALANIGTANLYSPSATPNSNTVFDTPVVWSPIAMMTNYGTGISQMDASDVRHLFATGRTKAGENLVAVTRDSGSGTRNGFNNTTGLDPSFGVGDNAGNFSNTSAQDLIGPAFIPNNKGGSGRLEGTVLNHRLSVGYSGAERGINSGWLAANRAEIVAIRNDLAETPGTQYLRPTLSNVLANSTADSYRIGGPQTIVTFGDPRAAAAADGGANWPLYNWTRDPRPVRPAPGICPACNDPLDPSYVTYKDATPPAAEPANTNPAMRNRWAAQYINNITRAAAEFSKLPGSDDTVFSPGEYLANNYILLPALASVPGATTPTSWIVNTGFNANVRDFLVNTSANVLKNPAYAAFNPAGTGRFPQRTVLSGGARYSDGNSDANTYLRQGGTTAGGTGALSLRNKIAGDFNGDGLRNANDIADMIRAYRDRATNGATPWNAPAGTGLPQSQGGIAGAPGADAIIEILGDFNGDGNFARKWNTTTNAWTDDKSDVRYFADGLAIDPSTGRLNRALGFASVDNAWFAQTGNNNFFGTVLATGGAYKPGDSAADIAGPSGKVARGWAPVGADGRVDARDIDAIYRSFKQNPFAINGAVDWANNTRAAALADLSADVNGDLFINQDDVCYTVTVILGTSMGDVNLDGVVNAADLAIATANLGQTGLGWAGGDVDGDGVVTQADINIILGLTNPCASCGADYNSDSFLNLDDLGDFITDYYTCPPIPGGAQANAPTYAGQSIGYGQACPDAPDAPAPYPANAYRVNGFRVGYSSDGSNSCPLGTFNVNDCPPFFPNLDNLGDYITFYYSSIGTPACQ